MSYKEEGNIIIQFRYTSKAQVWAKDKKRNKKLKFLSQESVEKLLGNIYLPKRIMQYIQFVGFSYEGDKQLVWREEGTYKKYTVLLYPTDNPQECKTLIYYVIGHIVFREASGLKELGDYQLAVKYEKGMFGVDDWTEDFARSCALYLSNKGELLKNCPKRYGVLKQIIRFRLWGK
jgi:hypothetical protein